MQMFSHFQQQKQTQHDLQILILVSVKKFSYITNDDNCQFILSKYLLRDCLPIASLLSVHYTDKRKMNKGPANWPKDVLLLKFGLST